MALVWPTAAEKLFAVTGATGVGEEERPTLWPVCWGPAAQPCRLAVPLALCASPTSLPRLCGLYPLPPFPASRHAAQVCAVCYVFPVLIHLRLYLRAPTAGFGSDGDGLSIGASRARRRQLQQQPSFAFGAPRLSAGDGEGGGSGPDTRWLLSADHHSQAAAASTGPEGQQAPSMGDNSTGGTGARRPPPPPGGGLLNGRSAWADHSQTSLSSWLRGKQQSTGSFDTSDAVGSPRLSPASAANQLQQQQPQQGAAAAAEAAPAAEKRSEEGREMGCTTYPCLADGAGPLSVLMHLVVPVIVLLLGIGFSASAGILSLAELIH